MIAPACERVRRLPRWMEERGVSRGERRSARHEVIINAVRDTRCGGHAAGSDYHAEGTVRSGGGRSGEVVVIKMHNAGICGQRGTS